jgi:hypothetical protein
MTAIESPTLSECPATTPHSPTSHASGLGRFFGYQWDDWFCGGDGQVQGF